VRLKSKKIGLLVVVLIGIATGLGLLYARSGDGVPPVNKTAEGLALRGYDAVAYFREGKAVQGREEFRHDWNGARWLFATAESRDLFARGPESYAPQYGGYCSWAVSHGYTADGDPEAWKVVHGKLYLNYNREVREMWEQDIPGFIAAGDRNWPRFLANKPEQEGDRR
jgi:hypothetical protein